MGVRHNMGCSGSDGNDKQEEPVRAEAHEEPRKPSGGGGKIKNGDAVHLVSVSGSNQGKCLHSNMAEGAGLSFGDTDRIDLGWVLDLDRTRKRKGIRRGDVVHLRPCGWGDGMKDDFYFHSNALEGGMFSGGGRNADCAWKIEGDSKHVRDGDAVRMNAIADAHDGSERGRYMHSNGEEGAGFSFGDDRLEFGWQLFKIDDFSTSKAGGGKKVKNGSYIHLRSVSGPNEGKVLHSNMEEGAMLSFGSADHGELGWRILAVDEDAGMIRYGMQIMLQGMGSGTCMHSNAAEGQGYSGGDLNPEQGYVIEGGDEGEKVRYGQTVILKCIAAPHDGSDRGPCMHSNGAEGAGFSFGADDKQYGWVIDPNSGWDSSSDY